MSCHLRPNPAASGVTSVRRICPTLMLASTPCARHSPLATSHPLSEQQSTAASTSQHSLSESQHQHLQSEATCQSLPKLSVHHYCQMTARAAMLRMMLGIRRMQKQVAKLQVPAQPDHLALLGVLFVPPVLPGNGIADLFTNRVFVLGFWAWFIAQFAKIFTKRYKKGVWDIKAVVDSGGMPSSHSSLCSGITTAVALQEGFGSPLFAACLAFSVIVMYDAMGVRRHAGKHAEVLNQVITELMEDHSLNATKLKEVLGHTPRQVICGALTGVAVAVVLGSAV